MLDPGVVEQIQSRVLSDLRKVFNKKLEDFFVKEFDDKLEAMVDAKIEAMLNTSSVMENTMREGANWKVDFETRVSSIESRLDDINNAGAQNYTSAADMESRLREVEEKTAPIDHSKLDKIHTLIEKESELNTIKEQNKVLEKQLQLATDENLANKLADKVIAPPEMAAESLK